MEEIYLDGERVEFSGNAPANLAALLELLEGHLKSQGRTLSVFDVDGIDILDSSNQKKPTTDRVVKATSISLNAFYATTLKSTLNQSIDLTTELTYYATEMLQTPWSETLQGINQLTEKLGPIANTIAQVEQWPLPESSNGIDTASALSQQLNESVGAIVDAAKRSDVAVLSDTIADELVPVIEEANTFFQQTLLPHFQS